MVQEYVDVIGQKIQREFRRDELIEQIHATNMIGSMRAEDKTLCLREYEKDLRKWLAKLKLPSVRRDCKAFEILSAGAGGGHLFNNRLRSLSDGWLPKVSSQQRTQMGTIMAALDVSPFRSLANAATAAGLDHVDAAFVAFGECPNKITGPMAANLLNTLVEKAGRDIAELILGELRSGAIKYECNYHPTLLSWVTDIALDELILVVVNERIRTREDVRERFADIVDKYVGSLDYWPIFKTLSQY